MEERYDVLVIGGGPGGYNAAIRAAQLGGEVALVEKGRLGGTCLQLGCIPTKALYESAMAYATAQRCAGFGVEIEGEPQLDFGRVMERKDGVVDQLTKGIEFLLSRNGVRVYSGIATVVDARTVAVESQSETRELRAARIIIATGSVCASIPGLEPDGRGILTSDDVLTMRTLPKSMVIVGGGVIGCEFATLFGHFGCRVWVVELLPQILSAEDEDAILVVRRAFKRQNVEMHTDVSVQQAQVVDDKVEVVLSDGRTLEAEAVLVTVGRSPNSADLGLEGAGIELSGKGIVPVDDHMRTQVDGVYAIGDVTGGFMLAHVASREGMVAASNAMGNETTMDYSAVPRVTFTAPQLASVGQNEKELKDAGATDYVVGKSYFKASGMAQCMGETDGFVKIILDRRSKNILGATIVGPDASNLVAGIAPLIGQPIEAMTAAICAHPTLAETIWEAAKQATSIAEKEHT